MKTKDVLVYGAIGLLGFAMIFLFFFTNIFFEWAPESEMINNDRHGLNRLNARVQKPPVVEYEEKVDLYDAELEKKREALEQAAAERHQKEMLANKQRVKLNDLSKFLDNNTKEENDLTSDPIPVESSSSSPQPSDFYTPKQTSSQRSARYRGSMQPLRTQDESTQSKSREKEVLRRRRTSDPTFGDASEEVGETVSRSSFVTAIVHGRQTATDGSRVTVRLTEAYRGRCVLPVNTMLTGTVSIMGQRMNIVFSACGEAEETLVVYDYSDNQKGLYVSNLSTNQELKREAAEETAGEVVRDLGVPVIGRVLRSGSNKAVTNVSVTLESGTQVYLSSATELK